MVQSQVHHPSRTALAAFVIAIAIAAITVASTARPVAALSTITISGSVTLDGAPAPIGTDVSFGPGHTDCSVLSGSPTTVIGQYSVSLECFNAEPQFSTADTFINGDITATKVCLQAGQNLTGVNLSYPSGGSPSAICVPTITDISPSSGPTAGGTTVTITGTFFSNGTTINIKAQVLIDGVQVPATDVAVPDQNHIVFITPAHVDDVVDIRVRNPGNSFIEKADAPNGFTYGSPSGGTVQFTSVAFAGNEAGPLAVNLTVSRTGGSVGAASATCALAAGGAATTPADFTITTATVTWNDGDTANKNCVVTIVNDVAIEGPESANFQLTGPTGSATLGALVSTVLNIADNDSAGGAGGSISYQSATYNASESTAVLNIAVTRTGGTSGIATATCTVAVGGTATSPADFTASFVNLTWVGGDSATKNCIFTIANDPLIEGPETINISLTVGGTGGPGSQTTAIITIADNDAGGTIQFGTPTYSGTEGGTLIQVAVTRTGGTSGASGAVCHIEPTGTATTPADFSLTTFNLSWSANDGSTKLCMVTILNDALVEGDETVDLSLTVTGIATLGIQDTAVVTIHDNDVAGVGGTLQFSSPTYSVTEGTASINIGVMRTGGSVGAASATCGTSGGGTATTPADFTMTLAFLNWASGDSSTKNCVITIVNDPTIEAAETVNLTLGGSPGAATFGVQTSAVLTINDNDGAGPGGTVQFGAAALSSSEGTAMVNVAVTRTGGSTGSASATCSVTGGTATAPADFSVTTGTVNWGTGDAAPKNCILTVVTDSLVEGDQTVMLTLGGSTGSATLGALVATTVTITDDDAPAAGTISIGPGATGALWTGSVLNAQATVTPFSRGFEIELPNVVNAVFRWNNQGQVFEFWFRGFPVAFNTLVDLDPGDFYFFQATAAGSVTVPNPNSYSVPAPGGSFVVTVTGATGQTWSGNGVSEAAIEAAMPAGVSAIFRWNDPQQSFEFWFRGFPISFDTLETGLMHGKYYFFQSTSGTVVPTP